MSKIKNTNQVDIFRRPIALRDARVALEHELKSHKASGHKKGIMGSSLQLTSVILDMGNIIEASELLETCEAYFLKYGSPGEKGLVHFLRGRLLSASGQYDYSMQHALRALQYFQQTDFYEFTAKCLVLCGILCRRHDMYNESLDYMNRAVETSLKTGIKGLTAMCMQNLNEVKMDLLPTREAIQSFQQFLDYLHEVYHGGDSATEVNALLCLSELYIHQDDIKKAKEAYERGNEMRQRINAGSRAIDYISRHAEILGLEGDEKGMLRETRIVIDEASRTKTKIVVMQAHNIRFRFYIARHKHKEAKKHLDNAVSLLKDNSPALIRKHIGPLWIRYYKATGDTVNELKQVELQREYELQVQQQITLQRVRHMTAVQELELKEKENENIKKELNLKSQELNMSNHYLQQRNELLRDLKESINSMKRENAQREFIFQTLFKKMDSAFNKEESEREVFKQKFDAAHADFIRSLSRIYPTLSSAECRICALLHSGFNTKDIATLLSTTQRNIETHRLHIRKKMKLKRTDNLHLVLASVKI